MNTGKGKPITFNGGNWKPGKLKRREFPEPTMEERMANIRKEIAEPQKRFPDTCKRSRLLG